MKIPNVIKIGGQIYEIIFEDNPHAHADVGVAQLYANQIYINTNVARRQQESTLIHEIIEVLNSQNRWGFNEQRICQLEAGLYQVLTDNDMFKEEPCAAKKKKRAGK